MARTAVKTPARARPAPSAVPRLAAHDLHLRRGHHHVLKGISLSVAPGECLGVAGHNAAGKSSLLGILAGWLHPTEGHVEIDGHHLHGGVPPEVGFAPQETSLYPHLTGRANLELFGRLYDLDARTLDARIEELVGRFELERFIDQEAVHYSGGVARRLHLALALIHRPRVVLLDEPTNGLDPSSRRTTLRIVADLLAEGTAVVMTSQLLGDLEVVSHRLMVLIDGERHLYEDTTALVGQMGAGTLYVELAQHPEARLDLGDIPGVLAVRVEHNSVTARLANTVEAVSGVLERLRQLGLQVAGVEVQPPSLEQLLHELVPDL